jgi:hypothetical protein
MSPTVIQRPASSEYATSYSGYVNAVPDGDLLALLDEQGKETLMMLRAISEEKSRYRYAPGKWSIREVIGHVNDAERVFTYRALSFARGERAPLPSFDENAWGDATNADDRTLEDHAREMGAIRAATLALFRGFSPEHFTRSGTASGHTITVRALAYVVAGHERHHVRILRERYGV